MTIYTVTIPLKNEIPVAQLQLILEKNIGAEYEKIELDNILGFRTKNGEWSNDFILVCTGDKKSLIIALSAPCDRMPDEIICHIPKLVTSLCNEKPFPIETEYLTSVGEPVDINLSPKFQSKCIEMFCGRGQGALPMVYISCLPFNYENKKYAVDPDRMAKKFTGLACVVTEDSLKTSYELRDATDGRKVYRGYVGIYYPHVKAYDLFELREGESAEQLESRVFDSIRQWWINASDSEYSWNRLSVLREKQAATAEKGEAKELIAAFESELSEARADNERLRTELQTEKDRRSAAEMKAERLSYAMQGKSKGCLLESPDFDEWYIGEFSDMVVNILKTELAQRTSEENRAYEVLSALIEKNPIIGNGEKLFAEMTAAIREADSTDKLLNALMRHDWRLIVKSPHIKLHFKGNPRYFATMAVTPSDYREKDNFISEIMNKINPKKG
ncbi:MAG: hypothetical protein LBH24_05185 [Clostridiales bacterium]|jgi:hypothetical protein|nr:hypothetical protein [Clostridiales bacterium]